MTCRQQSFRVSPANGAVDVSAATPIDGDVQRGDGCLDDQRHQHQAARDVQRRLCCGNGDATTRQLTLRRSRRSATLSALVNYTFTVLVTVKDVAGNPMGANFQFHLHDERSHPADGCIHGRRRIWRQASPTNTVVSATFSKAMDATTINRTTFTVKVTATSGGGGHSCIQRGHEPGHVYAFSASCVANDVYGDYHHWREGHLRQRGYRQLQSGPSARPTTCRRR